MPLELSRFLFSVGGGSHHKRCIMLAAVEAAEKGYVIRDSTSYTGDPYQPDLVIEKPEKYRAPGRRKWGTLTYWIDIQDSHDPRPDWKAKGLNCDDVLVIDVGGMDLVQAAEAIRRAIP